MAFDKSVRARIAGVTNQATDFLGLLALGDSSGGTFTSTSPNPLRGTRFWDTCQYVLTGVSVAGGATGGSWTVSLFTNAIAGFTGLPIASVTGLGPLSPRTVVMDNLHKSPASPIPTHFYADITAAGGGIWFQLHAIAKQYRGVLSTQGGRGAERILEGIMYSTTKAYGGKGLSEDTTVTITAGGASASFQGLDKMDVWDKAIYWVVAGDTLAGTHSVDIVSTIGGATYTVAATASAAIDVAGEKLAIPSLMYGCSPKPTHIIWTEVGAGGVSDAQVIVLAKSGRGSNVSRG